MDALSKIEKHIATYGDWRTERLRELRRLINNTAPELTEDFKWGVPVWTHNGLVCAISAFRDHVKINFFKGAFLPNPKSLFNSGLDSKEHRSINFSENDVVDGPALASLIRAATDFNTRK